MPLFRSIADSTTPILLGAVGTVVGCFIGYRIGLRRGSVYKHFKGYKLTDNPIKNYVIENSLREPKVLADLKEYTLSNVQRPGMLCSSEQSQLFRMLLKMLDAKKVIEVGVYTGYNTLSCALALPDDGKIVACDISEDYTSVGKQYWKDAGVDNKIDLRIQPASETLDELIAAGEAGTFDFVFIDADKQGLDNYYEKGLTLLRRGGIIALDNVLWSGRVINTDFQDDDTNAIRSISQKVKNDDRVDISMLIIGDGVTLAMKK
ncbi:probable caffeoyl-CoA O-methyltransferase 1 [Ptychodera flava]|uniref:probable caffeoyl-CoA O-methyltransferase 1 n=1 Tax=Ptychodera flava TaxID=63121 RepID=UPI00396A4826